MSPPALRLSASLLLCQWFQTDGVNHACVCVIPSLTVDEEFESVSNQVLKRTQAMLDKYRLLLFEEAKVAGLANPNHLAYLLSPVS